MNTTTNTRGVSEAMVMRGLAAWRKTSPSSSGIPEVTAILEAALSAEPAAQGEAFRRVGWMIESTEGKGWWTGKQVWDFTLDPNAAVVFPDESSAEWFAIARFNGAGKATEHAWISTAPPAQPAERVPEGWVLVPREPTDAMLSCLIDGAPSSWKEGTVAEFYGTREDMAENYKAMLAAAQQAAR